jgi:hypothetical protein
MGTSAGRNEKRKPQRGIATHGVYAAFIRSEDIHAVVLPLVAGRARDNHGKRREKELL